MWAHVFAVCICRYLYYYVLRGAPLVGLLASPASSHVSAPPRPHSHERRCTVSTRLNFTHRHTSTFTQHVHIHNTFFAFSHGGVGASDQPSSVVFGRLLLGFATQSCSCGPCCMLH